MGTFSGIGYIIISLTIVIYALTFYIYIGSKVRQTTENFAYAFLSVYFAFLGLGVASFLGTETATKLAVIAGDGFLFGGTVLLLAFDPYQIKQVKAFKLFLGLLIGIMFMIWRVNFFMPQPQIVDKVLLFNSDPMVLSLLGIVLLTIWVPNMIRVVLFIRNKLQDSKMHWLYISILLSLTLTFSALLASTIAYISIICSTILSAGFTILIVLNIYLGKKIQQGEPEQY